VDDYNIPGETIAERIAFLRAAAARCRGLSSVPDDRELSDTLVALAEEYEAQIAALLDAQTSGRNSDSAIAR